MSESRYLAGLLALLLFDSPALPDPVVLRSDTRVVQIDIVVTDRNGKPVNGLTKEDFVVTDSGKRRAIDIFTANDVETSPGSLPARSTERPSVTEQTVARQPNEFSNRHTGPPSPSSHSTILLLDETNAWFENVTWARQGVADLLPKMNPDEPIAVYVIARGFGLILLQNYTTDHELLLENLQKYIPRGTAPCMVTPRRPCDSVGDRDAQQDSYTEGEGSRASHEAVAKAREQQFHAKEDSEQARLSLQALADQLTHVPGRKSVYWITQGVPARLMRDMGQFAWDKTIAALNEANVAVNTVDSNLESGFVRFERGPGAILMMQQVAGRTGGTAYFGRNDIGNAMADGIAAARAGYTLAFYLPDGERDDKFHRLQVATLRPGLQLNYRQGYYARSTETPISPLKQMESGALESMLSRGDLNGVGMTVDVDSISGNSDRRIDFHLNLDPSTLSLRAHPLGWIGRVEETVLEQNDSGHTISRISDVKEFEVSSANRAIYDAKGITWPLSVQVSRGTKAIVLVIRDSTTGHLGSLTIPLP